MATCRDCYARTLTPDERERFNAERVTGCIVLCADHQAVHDRLIARLRFADFIQRPEDGSR